MLEVLHLSFSIETIIITLLDGGVSHIDVLNAGCEAIRWSIWDEDNWPIAILV